MWGLIWGIGLTILFLWPIIQNLTTHLTSRQDGILITWLINWGSEALLTGKNFFNPPFFCPYQNTIGYSDLFLSTAILNLPLKILGVSLITSHNLHLLGGSVMLFWGQYLLAHYLFKSRWIALISATVFAFAGIHLHYIVHLQSFLITGLPWYFFFFVKFLEKPKMSLALGMTIAGLYQFLNSPQSGLFLLIASLIFLLDKKIRKICWQEKKLLLNFGLGAVILIGFFYLPYFKVSQEFAYTRSIRDVAHFSHGIEKFFDPEILFLAGLGMGFWGLGWRGNWKINWDLNKKVFKKINLPKFQKIIFQQSFTSYLPHFFIIMLVGAVLMLGPVVKLSGQTFKIFNLPIPLPYTIFYYLFPGFKAFRSSERWILIFGFGLSICFGYVMKRAQLKIIAQKITLSLIVLFLWITQVPKLELFPIPTAIPPIYQIISQRPEKVLAEFPIYSWPDAKNYYHEADRLYFQTFHHKKLYNGYSGFTPPAREQAWYNISQNPTSQSSLSQLKNSGVELILLHTDENPAYVWPDKQSPNYQGSRQSRPPNLKLITCLNRDCLYQIN